MQHFSHHFSGWAALRCAALARSLMCKANTSGVMTFICFLLYGPRLLLITRSNIQMRSSNRITDPFRSYYGSAGKCREFGLFYLFYLFIYFAKLDDALRHRREQRSLPLFELAARCSVFAPVGLEDVALMKCKAAFSCSEWCIPPIVFVSHKYLSATRVSASLDGISVIYPSPLVTWSFSQCLSIGLSALVSLAVQHRRSSFILTSVMPPH